MHAHRYPSRQKVRRSGPALAAIVALAAVVGAIFASATGQPAATSPPAVPVATDESLPLLSPEEFLAWCQRNNTPGLRARLNSDGRIFIRGCDNVGDVLASASPSPPTPPPPTTPAPTLEPTTPPPTTVAPTPTPSTTPTPSPTPTAGPQLNCMPQPSRCGWPDATNTGVPPGTTLTVRTGDLTVTTPGAVLDALDIRGCLIIQADNVRVTRSRIGAGLQCPWYVVRSFGRSGVVIEDTEIVLTGWETKGIAFDGYTARRVWFHGGSDCAHMGANVVIVDSFCEIPSGGPADGPHYDGFQSDGGANIRLQHNTIRVPYSQTSGILMSTNTSPIRDVAIVDNLMAGGGYTAYCGTSVGPVQGTFVFTGNRIAKTYFPRGGYWGPLAYCEGRIGAGNVWDGDNSPL